MGKTDELLRSAGASISQAASFRPAPAAMPTLTGSARISDPQREGLDRSKEYWMVPLDRIDRDVNQPRDGGFDQLTDEQTGETRTDPEFKRLVDSLERDGLLQPITLVNGDRPGRFRVHIGERRFRAALTLGWDKIAARVLKPDAPDDSGDLLAKQVIENVIRADLKPIEQAKSFRALLDVHGWSLAKLGQAVGYSAGYISQRLKLLELPVTIQARVESGELDAMRAYHVAGVKDEAKRAELVAGIVEGNLSVQETAEAARRAKDADRERAKSPKGRAGGPKAKGKSKPASSRVFRTAPGIRATFERGRGVEPAALAEALREILAIVEGELGESQAA